MSTSLPIRSRRRRNTLISLAVAATMSVGGALQFASPAAAGSETYDYTFEFVNGVTLSGSSPDKVTFLPGAGGPSADAPIGMDVHLSCSDDFPGGFGEKDGPDRQRDSAWQISSYSIDKVKDGKVDKTCGNANLGGGGNPDDPGNIEKGYVYRFTFVNGVTIEGTSEDKVGFLANAGGMSVEAPIGMDVHLSCSDKFPGGFGEKDGPDPQRDSAWQIESYEISKVDKGEVKKTCGDSFGPVAPVGTPSVDIEKTVNGEDADSPTGPIVQVGSTVTFAYRVTNNGDVPLRSVAVVDETLGAVTCPQSNLAVGESMDCDEQTKTATTAGQQGMNSTVTAVGSTGAPTLDAIAAGVDKGHAYRFTFVNGVTISGTSTDNTAFLPNAGGTSVDSPIGMEVHVSCSDDFPGGFGEKDGPDPQRDSAWQIASFEIGKVKNGSIDKRCGQPAGPVDTTVTDSDPVNFMVEAPPKVPSIDIEKSVNGQDADEAPGPEFQVGDKLQFRYVVTNTGDTLLSDIHVTDSELGDIGCVVPNLGPGGSYGCPTVHKTAMHPGPMFMEGTVIGVSPKGVTVTDTDPVNFVVKASSEVPSIDIEKSVNGQDADEAPGPEFQMGDMLKFRYVVTNTGDTLLSSIQVTDSELGDIGCVVPNLGPGGSYGCPTVHKTAMHPGPMFMKGTVTGVSPNGVTVTDTDPVNFVVNGSVVG